MCFFPSFRCLALFTGLLRPHRLKVDAMGSPGGCDGFMVKRPTPRIARRMIIHNTHRIHVCHIW